MTRNAKPYRGNRQGFAGLNTEKVVDRLYPTVKPRKLQPLSNFSKLNPIAVIALLRFRDELSALEFNPKISALVDCCNAILDYCKEVHQ
jgi:hypothetical protein